MSPFSGNDFISNSSERTAAELFDKDAGIDAADRPRRLSKAMSADLLVYIFGSNKFRRGQTNCPRTPLLKAVRIDAERKNNK